MLDDKCRIVYRLDAIKKEEEADNTSVDSIVRRAYPCPHFFKDANGFFKLEEKKRNNVW